MQKVYLLLRSNKKTGPYTLEELLQFDLKPFDLVWVEGRSAAWQYPFEIPALQAYVPETPQAAAFQPIDTAALEKTVVTPTPQPKPETPKRIFVSVPKPIAAAAAQTAMERNETAPYAAASAKPSPLPPGEEKSVHTNYSRNLNDVEEDYTNWVYKQKTKKKTAMNPRDLVVAVLILGLIVTGYYVMSKPSVTNPTPANRIAQEQVEQAPVTTPTENEAPSNTSQQGDPLPPANTIVKDTRSKNPVSPSQKKTTLTQPHTENPMPVEKTNPNIQGDNDGVVMNKEPQTKQTARVEKQPEEKKKKLGEVIRGIFTKKDKKEETKNEEVVMEEPKPADNRQSQRRTETTESPSKPNAEDNSANLASQVDLTSNAPDNWMMGVKNLKITLRNRSGVTIQSASVTVSYYDENNSLLDKKVIYFSNVAPKGKATVGAPDHKWADHVDYKLTTVSAKEDRYASN